jgi:hypothetical protein
MASRSWPINDRKMMAASKLDIASHLECLKAQDCVVIHRVMIETMTTDDTSAKRATTICRFRRFVRAGALGPRRAGQTFRPRLREKVGGSV